MAMSGNRAQRTAVVPTVVLLALALLSWLAGGAQAHAQRDGRSHAAADKHGRQGRHHPRRQAVRADEAPATNPPAFSIHLTPTFEVGQAGWNVVSEENGRFGGSTGIGVIHPSTPFVSVSGSNQVGSHEWTTLAVTLPEVSTVLVEGDIRVPTEALPGLPYGLRAARVTTPYEEPQGFPGSLQSQSFGVKSIVALGGNGEVLPASTSRETRETPLQGRVHKWRSPGAPAQGSCELHTGATTGLIAQSGATLGDIRPYPGQIFAEAFLPCDATLYSLEGHELRAYVLLDAAHPGSAPAVIPGTSPVPGIPGVYSGNSGFYGGPTDITAERSGAAWIVVQGAGGSERMQLLEDISATIES